ncbi:hypothetical protein HQN89_02700 [Paenibacillus frigoriresistens]|nr:hypothetical protein [Paenibacillus frigoriresistens]
MQKVHQMMGEFLFLDEKMHFVHQISVFWLKLGCMRRICCSFCSKTLANPGYLLKEMHNLHQTWVKGNIALIIRG